MTVKDHYDKHLGNFYSWMSGDFEEAQKMQESFFRDNKITPFSTGIALDLGCGHGLQSISLAKRGFSVKAVDFNAQLLLELKQRSSNFDVAVIQNDILPFLGHFSKSADLVVCMGDTLTHLESLVDVETVIQNSACLLIAKEKIIISFRDLTHELKEEQRFISVRSDEGKILTASWNTTKIVF